MAIVKAQFPGKIWNGLSNSIARAQREVDSPPDYHDWDQLVAEVIALQKYILELQGPPGSKGPVGEQGPPGSKGK